MPRRTPARSAGTESPRDGSILLVDPTDAELGAAFVSAYRAAGAMPHLIPTLAARSARHLGTFGFQGHGGDALVAYVFVFEAGRRLVRVYPRGHAAVVRPAIRALVLAE